MPTLTEYFRSEARDLLTTLERAVSGARPDPDELHRTARGLRGTAQIAREERFFRAVLAFENVTRSAAAGVLAWSEDMSERARSTVSDLRALLEPHADAEELEARAAAVTARWQRGTPAPSPAPAAQSSDSVEFRQFAGRETAAIAETIDAGIMALQVDPMDREALRAILRRQRALLGAARLEEIPVVAEILRAVEDLTRVIAKLDVGVKKEWLDIYRVARDGLQAAIATLLRGDDPEPSHALSRLRHMRAELLERYGEGEAVSAAHDTPGLVQATSMAAATAIASDAAPSAPSGAEDVLELHDDADVADDDGVLELSDAAVFEDEAMLELSAEAVVEDEGVLELSDETVIEEEGVLELSYDAVVDDHGVLELGDDAVVEEEGVLELSDDAVEHEGVLDLSDEAAVDDVDVLELNDEAQVEDEGVLELKDEAVVADDAVLERSALDRALELGDILSGATGHDPRARAALDELLDILRKAFG